MTLPNSRANENEADLIGLEPGRPRRLQPGSGDHPLAEDGQGQRRCQPARVHQHPPSDSSRMANLQAAIPKVMPLYQQARRGK